MLDLIFPLIFQEFHGSFTASEILFLSIIPKKKLFKFLTHTNYQDNKRLKKGQILLKFLKTRMRCDEVYLFDQDLMRRFPG
jgi:hypothetical protein